MFDYLIGLSFEECIKVLEEKGVEFDFGEDVSYQDALTEIQQILSDEESSLEGIPFVYIGGYWGDSHQEVYFDEQGQVAYIEEETWD